jgi:SPP1 gp7 family putative phage head morphogenesis protein
VPFDLRQLARQNGRKRGKATFRPIVPTGSLASDLATIYLDVVREWTAALPAIEAEYARTLAQLTTDSASDLEHEISKGEGGLQRLFFSLGPRLKDWALRVERWHREKWRGAALSATGIDLGTVLTPGPVMETVQIVIARNVALVRNVSDQAMSRISDAVFRGVQARTPARDVAKQLREALGMSRRRSLLIASDQATKLTSDLDTERMKEAGIDDWEWKHSGKLHPRENHKARDGHEYTWQTAPNDMPGQLPYCGCRKLAVINFD